MGFRFFKSFRLPAGLRLNLSRGGVGFSFGVKGLRMGAGPRGAQSTLSIPGTGLSRRASLARADPRRAGDVSPGDARATVAGAYRRQVPWAVIAGALLLIAPPQRTFFWIALAVTLICLSVKSGRFLSALRFNRGLRLYLIGDRTGAAACLEGAVTARPKNDNARRLLTVVCHDELRDFGKAAEHSRILRERYPQDAYVAATLAASCLELGEVEEARGLLASLPPSMPAEVRAYLEALADRQTLRLSTRNRKMGELGNF